MKWIKNYKTFENVKVNNITEDDIINSIKSGGWIWATIINNLPDNDPDEPLKPVSIDEDGLVTALHKGVECEIDLKNVEKVDYLVKESSNVDDRSNWSSQDWRVHLRNLKREIQTNFDVTSLCYSPIGGEGNNTLEELYEIEKNLLETIELESEYLDSILLDISDEFDINYEIWCEKPIGDYSKNFDVGELYGNYLVGYSKRLTKDEASNMDSIWFVNIKDGNSLNRTLSASEFINKITKIGNMMEVKIKSSTNVSNDKFDFIFLFSIKY